MAQLLDSRIIKTEPISWRKLSFVQDENFKEWFSEGNEKLVNSLLKYQFIDPFKVWQDGETIYCLDGKHRYLDLVRLVELGINVPDKLPATFIDCADIQEAAELVLVYSSAYARITKQGLFDFANRYDIDMMNMPEINLPNFDIIDFHDIFFPGDKDTIGKSLKEDFGIIPFSILDSRTGEWLKRKRQWEELGFNSQETREDVQLIAKSGQSPKVYDIKNKLKKALGREPEWDDILDYARERGIHIFKGGSVFDPVLCELLYKWFTNKGDNILDPFSGGSVRGIVAAYMERKYHGIDLRDDQIVANKLQSDNLNLDIQWYTGDSNVVLDNMDVEADFVFSCPPYHDLEHYSDDPNDLSNMDYESFVNVYRSIISKSVYRLKENCFACFVVGDIRDKNGFYRNFVSETISAFEDAGMYLYNEMILINQIGSMAIRLRKQFNVGRKCGKIHQNVLIFYKGNPLEIRKKFNEIKFDEYLESKFIQPNLFL